MKTFAQFAQMAAERPELAVEFTAKLAEGNAVTLQVWLSETGIEVSELEARELVQHRAEVQSRSGY